MGFLHIYDCEEELVNDFKSFCEKHSCNRYNAGLKFLLEFYETFQKVNERNVAKREELKTFGGNSIKLNKEEDK